MGAFDGNVPSTGTDFKELLDGFSFGPGASATPWVGTRKFLYLASGGDTLPVRGEKFPDVPGFVIPDALTVRDFRVRKSSGVYEYTVNYSTAGKRITPLDSPQSLQVNMSSIVLNNNGASNSNVTTVPLTSTGRNVDFPIPYYMWGGTYTISTGVAFDDRNIGINAIADALGQVEKNQAFSVLDGTWLCAGFSMDAYLDASTAADMLRFTYTYNYKRINVPAGQGCGSGVGETFCGWNSFYDPTSGEWVRIDPPIFPMYDDGNSDFPAEHDLPFLDYSS